MLNRSALAVHILRGLASASSGLKREPIQILTCCCFRLARHNNFNPIQEALQIQYRLILSLPLPKRLHVAPSAQPVHLRKFADQTISSKPNLLPDTFPSQRQTRNSDSSKRAELSGCQQIDKPISSLRNQIIFYPEGVSEMRSARLLFQPKRANAL